MIVSLNFLSRPCAIHTCVLPGLPQHWEHKAGREQQQTQQIQMTGTYSARIIGRTTAVATAPLIWVHCGRRVRVATIYAVDAGLMCCVLKQLDASHPKQEDKDQQQQYC